MALIVGFLKMFDLFILIEDNPIKTTVPLKKCIFEILDLAGSPEGYQDALISFNFKVMTLEFLKMFDLFILIEDNHIKTPDSLTNSTFLHY